MTEKFSSSAEEEFAEACRASAEAYRNMRNRVRMRFHEAQQEAYISWAAWDEATGVESANTPIETSAGVIKKAIHAAGTVVTAGVETVKQIREAISRRRPVEILTGPRVKFAAPALAPSGIQELVVHIEELGLLGVQPYVRIDLVKRRRKWQVQFILERLKDPKRPARYLKPREGAVVIHLFRPASASQEIAVGLGNYGPNPFTSFSDLIVLNDYQEGEEHEWEVEVTIFPEVISQQP